MKVDQQWVQDNFDIVDKIFTRLNKGEKSSNLSRNRKEMKQDMDKIKFRGYYELARKHEKEKINKAKTIGDNQERLRLNQVIEANASSTEHATQKTEDAIDLLEDQLDVKDNQITQKDKQISEKDKQIETLLKTIELLSQKKSLSFSSLP
tara:strand:- start:177 stop:626 length:450 start_codon:yes stop_codon:yes gene_type:complete